MTKRRIPYQAIHICKKCGLRFSAFRHNRVYCQACRKY